MPGMVRSTTQRLKELKENANSSTWFKDHCAVFTDPSQLGARNIDIGEVMKRQFLQNVYRPYIQSVIDHINERLQSTNLISAMSVFDPCQLPTDEEELSDYGTENIEILAKHYGHAQEVHFDGHMGVSKPDIDPEDTESELKLFCQLMFAEHKKSSLHQVILALQNASGSFPSLAKIASILMVLPVTTATVERTFSNMKLIKTRLRSRMGESTLDHAMRICIEGPDLLSDETLEAIIDHYKQVKRRKLSL